VQAMYVDVTLGPRPAVALLGRDDARVLSVWVHGTGSLAELRVVLGSAAAGVPFGHEAAIDTQWIRAQARNEDASQWEERIGRLLAAAGRRGHGDVAGRWIVGPIIWQLDAEPAVIDTAIS
jgi:hypothetical protein